MSTATNIFGLPLQPCCFSPRTGFYRNGFCHTGPEDSGRHLVCAQMTTEFLEFSKNQGNDLSTPTEWFPGLRPGDRWCLCVTRWREAYEAGVAPPVLLESTHEGALKYVQLKVLVEFAVREKT